MDHLIDTHVCLWALGDKEKLSPAVKEILVDTSNKIFVSQFSLFEIAVKLKTGKLSDFKTTIPEFIDAINTTGFEILPCKNEHLIAYSNFDFVPEHRDPFDRYLLATAYFEKVRIISKDEKFRLYAPAINIVW